MDTTPITPTQARCMTTLGELADAQRLTKVAIDMAVLDCRLHGVSWARIALMLGVTTQAAWERYRPAPEPKPLPGQESLFPDTDFSVTPAT